MSASPASKPPRKSCPEQKPRPAPVMTTTRTAASAAASWQPAATASSTSSVSPLSTSGRFSVRVSTPASEAVSTTGAAPITMRPLYRRCSGGGHHPFAHFTQSFERVNAGVVAVGPHHVEPVGPHQRDVGEVVLARLEVGTDREAAGAAHLPVARGTGAGAAEQGERDAVHRAVVPLDEKGA